MVKFFTKIYKLKEKKQKGYAILFTIIIVSAISVITAGLTNTAYKQLILSSLAKDSQIAFYQADTAGDCALYADRVKVINDPTFSTTTDYPWPCGNSNLVVNPILNGNGGYTINPTTAIQATSAPCFRIDVTKDISTPTFIKTTIKAKGYNICNVNNSRTVEREILIRFQEEIN